MNLDRMIAISNNKTVYKDGERCVKVFGSSYPRIEVLNEALNLVRAEQYGFLVPALQEVTVLNGKWSIISDFIPGKPLWDEFRQTPELSEALMDILVTTQLQVQSVSCSQLRLTRVLLEEEICAAVPEGATRMRLLSRLYRMPVRENCFCHRGFTPENLILTEDGQLYILDWVHAAQGDPAEDAIQTWLWFNAMGRPDLAEQYLSLYGKRSGLSRKTLTAWIPIAAAAKMASLNRQKRAFLRPWLDFSSEEE